MSDTNKNRLDDPRLDADLAHVGDGDKTDPKPARLGSAPAPDGGDNPDRAGGGVDREAIGGGAPRASSVEGVDEAAAERESIVDATR
ncbi:hypothetical protein [Aureimonas psammosilenae]|uniref:hypothetical protein n=1 Tax=Aureimonas psammosilenae TaxID=2495496 RepID=UPI0012612C38|nr:hypothetical protein [Aureimonas psammosilenae]